LGHKITKLIDRKCFVQNIDSLIHGEFKVEVIQCRTKQKS